MRASRFTEEQIVAALQLAKSGGELGEIFLVSLARSARVETGLGTYSVHHVHPPFFDGFVPVRDSGINSPRPRRR